MGYQALGVTGVAVIVAAAAVRLIGTDAAQDLAAARLAARATAGNEAIAWSADTAEMVNVGLTVREHTIVNVAMFEAANAVTGRYRPYALRLNAPAGTSIDAAVATAAYQSLIVVGPQTRAVWDALYAHSMDRLADGLAKQQGIALGKAAAEGVLALRTLDTPMPGPAHLPSARWRLAAEFAGNDAGSGRPVRAGTRHTSADCVRILEALDADGSRTVSARTSASAHSRRICA
jgi:hypothetical protein